MVLKVDWELIGLGISRWCEEFNVTSVTKKATNTHDKHKHFVTNIDLCDLCEFYVIKMVEKALFFITLCQHS